MIARRVFILLPVALIIWGCTKEPVPPAIIPLPVKAEVAKAPDFILTENTILLYNRENEELERLAGQLAGELQTLTGIAVRMAGNAETPAKGFIQLQISEESRNGHPEGYQLEINEKTIQIQASSAAGIFYGIQTLLQLIPVEAYSNPVHNGRTVRLSGVSISDYPRYAWRGMHLDVSRHFFPKEFVKKYIDLIARYKMNIFHWHLTDDNGWRIEIKKYPKLTEIAAWRVDRTHQIWTEVTPPEPGEQATYGGFYTQDDIREIVAYARERFITIVPEIEMPGHTCEVFAAYPEYSCTGQTLYVQPGTYWPNTDIFCAGKEGTFTFIEDILTEVAALFPGPYIHIGGDEADKTRWKECKLCQKRIKDEGLKNEEELQSYFIHRAEKMLHNLGKRLIGWDEILEGGLAPDATVMSWRGFDGGIEAARAGHDVVMSPVSHCYFDYYQADPEFEPLAIGGFLTLKKVYGFDPTPPVLSADESKHILGGQANLWTEYIPTPQHAEYMALPRMTALSEALWSPTDSRDFEGYLERLQPHLARFDREGTNYSKGSFKVALKPIYDTVRGEYSIAMQTEQLRPEIRYSLGSLQPGPDAKEYRKPLKIKETTLITAAIFRDGKIMEKPSTDSIMMHKGIGSRITLETPPNFRYAEGTLCDGFRGSTQHRQGHWLGFYGDDLKANIQLREPAEVKSIRIGILNSARSWIFAPAKVSVSVSADGQIFTPVEVASPEPDILAKEAARIEYTANLTGEKISHLRVEVLNRKTCPPGHPYAGQPAWIFTDEIVIE